MNYPIKDVGYDYVRADIDESAKILADLAKNKERRESLANSGYTEWEKNFTWEKISEKYEQLYIKLIEK